MMLLDTTSTMINPNAIARQVSRSTIISLKARLISLLTQPYII